MKKNKPLTGKYLLEMVSNTTVRRLKFFLNYMLKVSARYPNVV